MVIEPPLLPLTGEQFLLRSTKEDAEARLDVSARGVTRPMGKVFFDVRISNPTAASNAAANDPFRKHEIEKKRTYNQRVIDDEKQNLHLSFSPSMVSWAKKRNPSKKRLATLL